MRFTTIALSAVAVLVSLVSANSIEYVNQDGTTRTIIFTPSDNMPGLPSVTVPGNQQVTVSFPHGWIGNWYAVAAGAPNVPGMLGEIAWDGWKGFNYYDVSAIVAPNDGNGVKMMFPKIAQGPVSGCQTFPCANAYNQPDDIQTLSTTETDIICLIGNQGGPKERRHARHFVLGN